MPRGRGKSQVNREAVYRFLIEYKQANDGCAPTIQEIMDGTGLKSSNHVKYLLGQLSTDGQVTLFNAVRKIFVTGAKWIPPTGSDQ